MDTVLFLKTTVQYYSRRCCSVRLENKEKVMAIQNMMQATGARTEIDTSQRQDKKKRKRQVVCRKE